MKQSTHQAYKNHDLTAEDMKVYARLLQAAKRLQKAGCILRRGAFGVKTVTRNTRKGKYVTVQAVNKCLCPVGAFLINKDISHEFEHRSLPLDGSDWGAVAAELLDVRKEWIDDFVTGFDDRPYLADNRAVAELGQQAYKALHPRKQRA